MIMILNAGNAWNNLLHFSFKLLTKKKRIKTKRKNEDEEYNYILISKYIYKTKLLLIF